MEVRMKELIKDLGLEINSTRGIFQKYSIFLENKTKENFLSLNLEISRLLRRINKKISGEYMYRTLPDIKYCTKEELKGNRGCYDSERNIIYICGDTQEEKIVLLHEVIHFVQGSMDFKGIYDEPNKSYLEKKEEKEAFGISIFIFTNFCL